jgi:signal peptidase I
VNKFHYGLRMPVFTTKLWHNNDPQRGDVMVFRYPPPAQPGHQARHSLLPNEVTYPEQAAHRQRPAVPKSRSPIF